MGLLPSGTIYSGQQPWVSVDAAISNDIFYYEHNAAGLDNLLVIGPDGQPVQAENQAKGRYRSVFDVKLSQQGTYRIALVNDGLIASFKVGTETKRLRGTAESLAKEIPANAEDLRVSQSQNRVETFVTSGKPTTEALKPTGRGIELVPVTHPNDLVEGDTATFRFLDNGKPAAGYSAAVILGGLRYRSELGEMRLTTDARGEIQVKWPAAGMYWVNIAPPAGRPLTVTVVSSSAGFTMAGAFLAAKSISWATFLLLSAICASTMRDTSALAPLAMPYTVRE